MVQFFPTENLPNEKKTTFLWTVVLTPIRQPVALSSERLKLKKKTRLSAVLNKATATFLILSFKFFI